MFHCLMSLNLKYDSDRPVSSEFTEMFLFCFVLLLSFNTGKLNKEPIALIQNA